MEFAMTHAGDRTTCLTDMPRSSAPSIAPRPHSGWRLPATASIRVRHLCPIDDQDFNRSSCRFQLQAELLLHGGEDRRRVARRRPLATRRILEKPVLHLRIELEIDIEPAREPGPIDDGTIDQGRK